MAMVAAFELHRELPSRGRPGQPDSAHGRFGTGADEPDLVHGGKGPAHELGHLDLQVGGRAVAHARSGLPPHRIHHGRVAVTQDERSPGKDEIDIPLPLSIGEEGSRSPDYEGGGSAHLAKGADRRVHTARNHLLCSLEQLLIRHWNPPGGSSAWMSSSAP